MAKRGLSRALPLRIRKHIQQTIPKRASNLTKRKLSPWAHLRPSHFIIRFSLVMAHKSFVMRWHVDAMQECNGKRYQRMRLPTTQISRLTLYGNPQTLTSNYTQ